MNHPQNFSWIWPRACAPSADGTLCFKTSGWDGDLHWSGEERFVIGDELHRAMLWIARNRRVLPPLLLRDRIPGDVWKEESPAPLPDGVHAMVEEELVRGWSESLGVPVEVVNPAEVPGIQRLLARLSGGNCFLFLDGVCHDAMMVEAGTPDEVVTPARALEILKESVARHRGDSEADVARKAR